MDVRLAERFARRCRRWNFCSLRYVRERSDYLAVTSRCRPALCDVKKRTVGAMLTVYAGSGMGMLRRAT